MSLEAQNLHWMEGHRYGFETKRDMYYDIERSLEKRRITVITGTRRVGKTTIIKQLIDHLIDRGTDRKNILYFSFDEAVSSIKSLIKEYERKLGNYILNSEETYYIFLDEVQKLKGWHEEIKYFYDTYQNIKFTVSGSASLFIRKGLRESLAGRVREFYVPPLSFREYLRFRGREDLLENRTMFEETLSNEFERYLTRQYIEIIDEDDEEVKDYIKSMVEKVIFIDIPSIFPVDNPHLLMRLFVLIASSPGMLLEYSSLSRAIGEGQSVSRVTVSKYVHYLEDAYLIKITYNYSGSAVVSERKLKKAYLTSTSMCVMADKVPELGKLVENTVFIWSNTRFFWRTPQKNEVDIVVEKESRLIPIEVKYQNEISRGDMKNLMKFMKKYGSKNAILLTKSTEGIEKTDYGDIEMKMVWKHLI